MVEPLAARSPLETLAPRRYGIEGPAGLVLRELAVGGAVSLAAGRAGTSALAALLEWELPDRPRAVAVLGGMVLWTGPGRWLALTDRDREFELSQRAGATGSVADQGGGRVLLALAGARARDSLAKGFSIDLHPRVFQVHDVAATQAAHIPVLLWRRDEDTYVMIVARAYAESFASWLIEAGSEFGLEFAAPGHLPNFDVTSR